MEKYKDIREALKKEGKIIGFQHNNLRIGLDKTTRKHVSSEAVKDAREDAIPVKLYFAQWSVDEGYEPLGEPGTYSPNYFQVPLIVPANPSYPSYTPEFTGVHDAVLMDVILNATPTVSAVSCSGDTLPLPDGNGVPDWLEGLLFSDGTTSNRYDSVGEYSQPYQKPDGHTYIDYTGSDWMYILGSPTGPDADHPGLLPYPPDPNNPGISPHPSPYPWKRLDEFTVAELVSGYQSSFTLSYETQSFSFRVDSSEVNGETVHTLTLHSVKVR